MKTFCAIDRQNHSLIIRNGFFIVSAFLFFIFTAHLHSKELIPFKLKGTIACNILIPNAGGNVTLSLYTLTGEEVSPKRVVSLPRSASSEPIYFRGCSSGSVYIVEAEGELTLEDGTTTKHFSRAMKVTTDEKGSGSITFGN